jgi:UDP-2,3-diacylglucosamine pyrophosphatase LpxH
MNPNRVLDNALNGFSVEKARNLLHKKSENMLTAARCMSKVTTVLMQSAHVFVIVMVHAHHPDRVDDFEGR